MWCVVHQTAGCENPYNSFFDSDWISGNNHFNARRMRSARLLRPDSRYLFMSPRVSKHPALPLLEFAGSFLATAIREKRFWTA